MLCTFYSNVMTMPANIFSSFDSIIFYLGNKGIVYNTVHFLARFREIKSIRRTLLEIVSSIFLHLTTKSHHLLKYFHDQIPLVYY